MFNRSVSAIIAVLVSVPALAQPYILVGDRVNDSVRKYSTDGTYLGDLVAPGAGGLDDPLGLAIGEDGTVYVGGDRSGAVHTYNGETGAPEGILFTPGMRGPAGLAFNNGLLHVADGRSGRVTRFDADTGAFVDNIATNTTVPEGMAWDDAGNFYVGDWWRNRITVHDAETGEFKRNLVIGNGLDRPLHMKISENGDSILAMNYEGSTITEYDLLSGDLISTIDLSVGGSPVDGPVSWFTLDDGSHVVTSSDAGLILKYNEDWSYQGIWAQGEGLGRPNAIVYVVPSGATSSGLGLVALAAARRRRR